MQRRTGTSPGGGPRTDDRANRRHADLLADVPAPLRFDAADQLAREGGEDRREGDLARPLPRLPDGGGGGAARAGRPHLGADRKATSARPSPMLTLEGCNGRRPEVELRPECVLGVPQSGRTALG